MPNGKKSVILQLDFDSRNPEALCLDLVPEKSEKFSETQGRGFSTCAMRGLLSISCFKVHFSLPFRRGLAYSATLRFCSFFLDWY